MSKLIALALTFALTGCSHFTSPIDISAPLVERHSLYRIDPGVYLCRPGECATCIVENDDGTARLAAYCPED